MRRLAHTVAYDAQILDEFQRGGLLPADRWSSVTVPALVIAGGNSPEWIRNAAAATANALPNADLRVLDGERRMVRANATAPVLRDFFAAAASIPPASHQPAGGRR